MSAARERGLVPRPVLDLGATVIVAVTAGGSAPDSRSETAAHSCALDDGGVVRCWGSNDLGQLGDGTRDRRIRPVIAQLAGTERVVEVSAGGRYTCVRTERGLVRCFGASQPGLATEPLPDAGF